jgi:hypothetical protein
VAGWAAVLVAGWAPVLMARRAPVLMARRAPVLMARRAAVLMAGRRAVRRPRSGGPDGAKGPCSEAPRGNGERSKAHPARAQRALVPSISVLCSQVLGHQQPPAIDAAGGPSYGSGSTKSRRFFRWVTDDLVARTGPASD